MVDEILNKSGVPHRRNRFVKPPRKTYAVWADLISTDGADGMPPSLYTHDVTIEVFEYEPDDTAEAAIEAAMGEAGLHWMKRDRDWIEVEQVYQVTYDFTYIEKRRN